MVIVRQKCLQNFLPKKRECLYAADMVEGNVPLLGLTFAVC